MAWCPVCKNEYRPGVKVCADCGAELVDSLEDSNLVIMAYGEQEHLIELDGFLNYGGLPHGEIEFDDEKGTYCLKVDEKHLARAKELFQLFINEKTNRVREKVEEEALANATPEQIEALKKMAAAEGAKRKAAPYESSEKKMEENKAAAWSLLLVGAVGIVLIVLCLTGVFPLPTFFKGAYLFFGIMAALCALFIVAGLISFKSAKSFAKEAESENSIKASLTEWCKENLRGEDIDRYILMRNPGLDQDAMFFPRNELLKARINHQFMNLDQAFLDRFIDDVVYEMVFPEGK